MATSVFDKYGGFGVVSRVVLDFYDRVLEEEVLAPYFARTDMRTLVDHQTKFIAQVMGGPVAYADETLRRVHAHLNITEDAFTAMNRVLEETLEDHGFEQADIDRVMLEIKQRHPLIVSR